MVFGRTPISAALRRPQTAMSTISTLDHLLNPPDVHLGDADLVVWTYILRAITSNRRQERPATVWLQARLKMPPRSMVYKAVYKAVAGMYPELVPEQDAGYREFNCSNPFDNEFDGFLKNHLDDFRNIASRFGLYVDHEEWATGWLMRCYYEQPLLREMRESKEEVEAEYERRRVFGDFGKLLKGMRR